MQGTSTLPEQSLTLYWGKRALKPLASRPVRRRGCMHGTLAGSAGQTRREGGREGPGQYARARSVSRAHEHEVRKRVTASRARVAARDWAGATITLQRSAVRMVGLGSRGSGGSGTTIATSTVHVAWRRDGGRTLTDGRTEGGEPQSVSRPLPRRWPTTCRAQQRPRPPSPLWQLFEVEMLLPLDTDASA